MAPKRKSSPGVITKRGRNYEAPFPQVKYDIPYFAHMWLNPNRYSTGVAQPVGGPIFTQPYSGSREDDEEMAQFDEDLDFDENLDPLATFGEVKPKTELEITPVRPKRGIKREAEDATLGSKYKKFRGEGGRAVVAKPVTFDMDSDDELIIRMKEARYLEKDIADRLAAEGRTRYMPKTIGTRWARIKTVLQNKQDEMLDNELTDWHEGDDEVLMQAIAQADRDIEKAKELAESKKWKLVSDHMKSLKPVTNFSKDACQSRFHILEEGDAKQVPERVQCPDDKTLAAVERRRQREEAIRIMQEQGVDAARQNLTHNAWTSRMVNV